MMQDDSPILTMALYLAMISLIAVGGLNSALPDMHRMFVEQHGWLTDQQFTSLFALAQAAPGPNMLFATVIGFHVGGLLGAFVATAAVCGPSSIIALALAHFLEGKHEEAWFKRIRRGLFPVTLGLMLASAILLPNAAATSWKSYAVTGVAAAFMLTTRFNPLWALAAAGVLGLIGIV
jgi:chromate transporter